MTPRPITVNVSFSRASGGSHLMLAMDELDLPWLVQLIDGHRGERDVLVSLVDSAAESQLLVRIDEGRFGVERLVRAAGSRLVRQAPGGDVPTGGEERAFDSAPEVDLDAVQSAVENWLRDRPLPEGLRWVEQ